MSSTMSTDPRLMQMFRTPITEAIVDYFVDKVTTTVAQATIAQPYRQAFELKTYHLMYFVHCMIGLGKFDMQVILTAIVYLDRVRVADLWAYGDEFICERLIVGALKVAQKWVYDERHHYTKWTYSSQFSREDVDLMERHFLRLIDYNCWTTPGAYLEHYAPLMQYVSRLNAYQARTQQASIFQPRKPEEPRIFLPEPEPELVSIHPLELEPKPVDSAANVPDLMYPESPLPSPMAMSDDDAYEAIFSSDDESSDESPEAITPPDAARHQAAAAAAGTHTHTQAATQEAAHQQPNLDHLSLPVQKTRDAEMDARIRFYAADHGTVLYPSGTPQFVPPSPSPANLQHYHYEHRDSNTVVLASRAHVPTPAMKPSQSQSQSHGYGCTQPWHQMQAWRSAGLSGNTTWGTLGLFVS